MVRWTRKHVGSPTPSREMSQMTEVTMWDADQVDLFDGDDFATGYSLPGYSKVDKSWLIGVPHVITRVTFWTPGKVGVGFCSVEAHVGTEAMLKKAVERGNVEEVRGDGTPKVDAKEPVIYNDGGTGIRRQLVSLLSHFELLTIKSKLPEEGGMGESRYDLPWTQWDSFSGTTRQGDADVPSFQENHNGSPFRIIVRGGLQASMGGANRPDGAEPTYYLR